METVVEILRWIFAWLLFPVVVLGLFYCLIHVNVLLIEAAKDIGGRVRRLVGALLPAVVLIFLVTASDEPKKAIELYLLSLSTKTKIISGAVLGALLIRVGQVSR